MRANTRSALMSRIRGKDTKPEMRLRRALWAQGLRYRLQYRTPVGRPDLVFPGPKVAVFVDGCFWHGCPHHYVRPRSRREFWSEKLEQNFSRDHRQTTELESSGWTVLRFWEHEIFESLDRVVSEISSTVTCGRITPPSSLRAVAVTPVSGSDHEERWCLRDLRDPKVEKNVVRERSTAKWRTPKD